MWDVGRRGCWAAGVVAALLLAAAPQPSAAQWSGSLASVATQRLGGAGEGRATGLDLEARLKYSGEFGAPDAAWSVRLDGRLRSNSLACSRPVGPQNCDQPRWDADWRELYAARQFGDWRAAIGWQQVVWGRADNLRVLDLVNPLDLRDFVLPDFNDIRRSQPMLKLNGRLGDWGVEAVVLPVFEPNRLPRRGAEFYFGEAEQFAAQGVTLLGEQRPARTLGHGVAGLLLSRSLPQIDWSLMALSTYNADAVYRLNINEATARPEFHRHAVIGASLAAPLAGGWVLRSEASWSPNTAYSAAAALGGIERSPTTTALLGLDYGWRDWLFTAQATDRWIAGWRPDYGVPQRATVATLSATGTALAAKLTARIALAWMPQQGDGSLWQVKLGYRPDDQWLIEAALDLLNGQPGGFFGQFRDRDRLRLELRRQF